MDRIIPNKSTTHINITLKLYISTILFNTHGGGIVLALVVDTHTIYSNNLATLQSPFKLLSHLQSSFWF